MDSKKREAYSWKTCGVQTVDAQVEQQVDASLRMFDEPWQNIDVNSKCRKAWVVQVRVVVSLSCLRYELFDELGVF